MQANSAFSRLEEGQLGCGKGLAIVREVGFWHLPGHASGACPDKRRRDIRPLPEAAGSLGNRASVLNGKKENMWAIAWRLQECRTQHCAYFTLENKATYPMFSCERRPVACERTDFVSHRNHRIVLLAILLQTAHATMDGELGKNTTITTSISRSGRWRRGGLQRKVQGIQRFRRFGL